MPLAACGAAATPAKAVGDRPGALQPKLARPDRDWLEAIRAAHRLDTWGEAARVVLFAIAADPADPVNGFRFRAEQFPARSHKGLPARVFHALDNSICVRLPAEIADHAARLTRGGGFATRSRALAAILKVARRLDDGTRYRPEAAS